jgi:signal transduction histidine kinase
METSTISSPARSRATDHAATPDHAAPVTITPCRGSVCRVEIEQVIVNLLQNAVDAVVLGEHGRRQIVLETMLMQGNQLRVSVSDSGSGISQQLADRMFEPFFTTKPAGLGMGLAISRSIVEAHGGCIWVDTQCAAVCFTLPLDRSDQA